MAGCNSWEIAHGDEARTLRGKAAGLECESASHPAARWPDQLHLLYPLPFTYA